MTTTKTWSEMTPRERNALVAEKVLGWERWEKPGEIGPDVFHPSNASFLKRNGYVRTDKPFDSDVLGGLNYTTDIADAWQVVEALRNSRHVIDLQGDKNGVACAIRSGDAVFLDGVGRSFADTAPEAICLAALRARGVNV